MKVFSNARLPPEAQEELAAALKAGGHELADGTAEAEVVFGQPNLGHIELGRKLRLIHLASGGWDHWEEQLGLLRARKIALTCSGPVYAEPCAEYVLARIMEDTRTNTWGAAWLTPMDYMWRRSARPTPWESRPRRLADHRVVVVGHGHIGQVLVRWLQALGMNVTIIRRAEVGNEPASTLGTCDPTSGIEILDERQLLVLGALAKADHVVDVLPGGSATNKWFDRTRLSAMKQGSAFYNVGRGSTVDHDALCEFMVHGRIRAAYLDVTLPEPLLPGDRLLTMPGCRITPHIAGNHRDEGARLVELFLDNLRAFEGGRWLSGGVDLR